MIFDSQLPELRLFRSLERGIRIQQNPAFASLVIAGDNEGAPVHRWFRFKESYSEKLLPTVLNQITPKLGREFSLLDPFCGMGTTLTSAQLLSASGVRVHGIGIERNPFARWAAEVKVNWHRVDLNLMEKLRGCVRHQDRPALPTLTSISQGRCISRYMARRIISTRDALLQWKQSETREAMLLGLASAIEPLSKVRKDGRALRIVQKPLSRFETVVGERWSGIEEDVIRLRAKNREVDMPEQKVLRGDGRNPVGAGIARNSVDLVLTSPPYPNNIDYSEVYKLELWLLGFIADKDSFLKLRKSTFRSHPTCDSSSPSESFTRATKVEDWGKMLGPLLERTEMIGEKWRSRLIRGYFADLWTSLQGLSEVLKPGGFAVIVIGNSLHGTNESPCLIPTDLILGLMGRSLGFELERLLIARPLKRRLSGNHFLRESVVVLRKPYVS
jgi:hypothetical protein